MSLSVMFYKLYLSSFSLFFSSIEALFSILQILREVGDRACFYVL